MLKVNVIGIGPGNPDLLTGEARQAIAESTILAGDKRMVGQFGSGKKVCPTIKLAELGSVRQSNSQSWQKWLQTRMQRRMC